MKQIIFVTSNSRKLSEARAACDRFYIEIVQKELSIDEIQAHDPKAIALHKAEQAFEQIAQSLVVTDTNWWIPALNGFPGGYMKDVAQWFLPEDFLALVAAKSDKRIGFTETIIYKDASQTKIFSKEYIGRITQQPRGNGNSLEKIAEFSGHTLAEHHDNGRNSHDPEDYVWYDFATWFAAELY